MSHSLFLFRLVKQGREEVSERMDTAGEVRFDAAHAFYNARKFDRKVTNHPLTHSRGKKSSRTVILRRVVPQRTLRMCHYIPRVS